MIIGKFSMDDDERLIGGESGGYLFGLFCLDDFCGQIEENGEEEVSDGLSHEVVYKI